MNRIVIWVAGFLAAALAFVHAAHAGVDPAFGDWVTADGGGKVRIEGCPNNPAQACGTLVWLAHPDGPDGKPSRDVKNPNVSLRSRPLVGLPMISGFRNDGVGRWDGGVIYSPGEGRTFKSKMAMGQNGTLKVSGCILMFCQAQTWTRAP
jgi:uncharacterized protein (DUF2147 family)